MHVKVGLILSEEYNLRFTGSWLNLEFRTIHNVSENGSIHFLSRHKVEGLSWVRYK